MSNLTMKDLDYEKIIEKAVKAGLKYVFTSLNISEEKVDKQSELEKIIRLCTEHNLNLIVDINSTTKDIANLNSENVYLRIDDGFTVDEILNLSEKNKIVLNASTVTEEELEYMKLKHAKFCNMLSLHNFYPKRFTGISKKYLLEQNLKYKKYGIRTMAFVKGDELRGPVYEGLPTVEEHRNMRLLTSCLDLLALSTDVILIGDVDLLDEKDASISSIKVELSRASNPDVVLATMILNVANNWKGIFKLTIDGKTLDPTVIDYQVKEVIDENYGKDYDTVITGDATQKEGFTITNTRKTTTHTVKKVWEDSNNAANKRPTAIKVQLKNNAVIVREERVTGKKVTFYEADIRDEAKLDEIFEKEGNIFGVIHFAGLKAVGESCQLPLKYYDNNVAGTTTLCRVMEKHNCKNIIFSSSATVYGDPHALPIKEDFPLSVTNPYGRTKLILEEILGDVYAADNEWNVVLLRYFNPIGAHECGDIGEDPTGIPNNLLPYVMQVAVGKLEKVNVFGDDFDTHDGTGVRDYIHVVDLARGHVAALKKLEKGSGLTKYNLGTGVGYSVLDIIKSASAAVGRDLPYVIAPRRAGDIAACYADASKAKEELGWEAQYDVKRMCEDSWRWQSKHPNGFAD